MIKAYRPRSPVRNYLGIKGDAIGFLTEVLAECGDVARVNILGIQYFVVNDPALIREALVEKHETLIIKGGVSAGLARLIGHGILTNRGERWRESRRQLQPLFQADAIESSTPTMVLLIHESLERWRSEFAGRPFAINREILALTIRISCSTLFDYLPTFDEALDFADAIWTLQADGMRRHLVGLDHVPWLPVPLNRRVARAKRAIYRLAENMVRHGTPQPVDEILSILFAGTESPANTLCWGLKLLGEQPAWRDRLVDRVRGSDRGVGCPAGHAAAGERGAPDQLSQVLAETLRLYPAGWAFERFAAEATSLGGEPIGKGSRLLFSPFLLHRNPRLWNDPESFDPGRFSESLTAPPGIPKYGFLPFGAGPRSCIGSRLALAEMRLILAAMIARCRWTIDPPGDEIPLEPQGSYKIRLNQPMQIRLDFYEGTPGEPAEEPPA